MTKRRELPLPKNMPHLMAALFLVLFGHNMIISYSAAHWDMMFATSRIKAAVPMQLYMALSEDSSLDSFHRERLEETIEELQVDIDKLTKARRSIMGSSSSYHFAGLLSVIFWLFGFRKGPKWFALLFLPVLLYGIFLFGCVM